jgi:hypothetical protein
MAVIPFFPLVLLAAALTSFEAAAAQQCIAGQQYLDTGSSTCLSLTICPVGTETAVAATATSDRTCAACGTGFFQDQPGQPTCKVARSCNFGFAESAAPTASTNRQCMLKNEGSFLLASGSGTLVGITAFTAAVRQAVAAAAGVATADVLELAIVDDSGAAAVTTTVATIGALESLFDAVVSGRFNVSFDGNTFAAQPATFTPSKTMSDDTMWYEEIWFFIAVGAGGGSLLLLGIVLCCMCRCRCCCGSAEKRKHKDAKGTEDLCWEEDRTSRASSPPSKSPRPPKLVIPDETSDFVMPAGHFSSSSLTVSR